MPPAATDVNISFRSSDILASDNDGESQEDDFLNKDNDDESEGSSSSEEESDNEEEDRQDEDDNKEETKDAELGETKKKEDIRNKKLQAELKRLTPRGRLANYVKERIKTPAPGEPVRPPATIPTPNTFQEAMRSVDSEQWKSAMDKEMHTLKAHDVADLLPAKTLPPDVRIIGSDGCTR